MARKGKYPPSVKPGIPRLGRKPTGWTTTTFGDVLQVVSRKASIDNAAKYQLVTAKRNRGGIVPRSILLGKDIKTKTQFFIKSGDFLISRRQIVHGACGIVPPELDGALVSNEYSTLLVKVGLSLNYFNYFCHTVYFQQTCFQSSVGVDVEKMVFDLPGWLKYKLHLPPISEQQKIVDILGTWDKTIALTEQLLAAKQNRKWWLIQQLLTGKRRFKEFEDEWKSTTLQRMVETKELLLVTDGDWVESKDQDPMGQVRLIQLADIGDGAFLNKSNKFLREQVADRMDCTYLQSGDILVARMPDPLGRACVFPGIDKKAVTAVDVCVIRTNNNAINRFWLAQHINSDNFRQQILSLASGTTRTRISRRNLGTIPFLVPSLSEQDRIGTVLQACDAELNLLMQKLAALKRQKQGLMQQLLTGKVQVKTG
jgi:type I restriction enzyme, S subunit